MTCMNWPDRTAPDLGEIEALARATIESLPDAFRDAARQVILRVEEFASADVLKDLGIDDPFELTGLYEGVPLTQKSIMDMNPQADVIWLFRRPILEEWKSREGVTLNDMISHVYVHELAHHFGWSDDDIAFVDPWWE